MEEENHLNPLAPSKIYTKSDEELATNIKPHTPPQNHQKNTNNKCLVHTMLILVSLSIAFLIFGLAVLRINTPRVRVTSVAINHLNYDSSPSLNMTMVAEIHIRNQNFGAFNFRGGSTTLMYENATIGTGNIDDGRVGRRERGRMNVTVRVVESVTYRLSEVNGSTNFSRDVNSGLVSLRSYAELRGEVRVMRIVNRHRTAVMNCRMVLNLTSQIVQGLSCQ